MAFDGSAAMSPRLIAEARTALATRLRERLPELEATVAARVYAITDPTEAAAPEYGQGLRASISAALDYGLAIIECGEERAPPPPIILLAQARLAARRGIGLDTVLRRYFAGYALLGDFLVEEADDEELVGTGDLQRLLRSQATVFDRLLSAVSEEHLRESRGRPRSSERQRAERIERLLAGELIDPSGLTYDFDAHHLGAIAAGPRAAEAIRELASALDRRLLITRHGEEAVWAWLGGQRQADLEQVERIASARWPAKTSLAFGEPAKGLSGWRLTHRQAKAALLIAQRSHGTIVRYADVALLASVLQDDLLATSLRQLYLEPLEAERGSGEATIETLRAYFAADRNMSSAAAALKINRNTVASRLRGIEAAIGRELTACAAELETALRLDELAGHETRS